MRNTVMAAVILLAGVGVSQHATAQPVYVPAITADEAQDIAVRNGVIALRKLELDEGRWKLRGIDESGRRVEMKIDRATGAILELNRFD